MYITPKLFQLFFHLTHQIAFCTENCNDFVFLEIITRGLNMESILNHGSLFLIRRHFTDYLNVPIPWIVAEENIYKMVYYTLCLGSANC